MARLPYVEADRSPAKVPSTYEKVQPAAGRVPNFLKVLAHFPKGMQGFLLVNGVLREGTLDPRPRELAHLKASRIDGCHY